MTTQNRIALIDISGRLCTCNPDGSDYRVLTRADRIYQFPAWSPDGRWIAAVGSDRSGSGVYVFGDGGEKQQWQLYRSKTGDRKSPFYLYWSPDSEQVSFIANHPTGGIGLHVVRCNPHAESRLLAIGQPFFWQWGLDSAEILIHAGINEEKGRLAFLDPELPRNHIHDHVTPGYFQSPGFSVNGKYLAYGVLDENQQSSIVIEDRVHGVSTSFEHLGASALTWSPTKSQLAFMAPEDSNSHFYGPLTLVAPDGKRRKLTTESILGFFWSPDGNKIAYFAPVRDDSPLAMGSTNGKNGKNGKNGHKGHNGSGPKAGAAPATEPKEETIQLEVWVIDLTLNTRLKMQTFRPTRLFINQFLPFFDQYAHSHRIWSPDSEALILPLMQGTKSEITVLPLNNDKPTVLTEGYMGFWSYS